MKPRRRTSLSLIERAFIERDWHATAVVAQIHALAGDNSDKFVNAAGRIFFVVLGACIAEEVDSNTPELRILRGACNAMYEQAGEPVITPARRASMLAGLTAAEALIGGLERRSLIASACDLELKLRAGHINWHDFLPALDQVAA